MGLIKKWKILDINDNYFISNYGEIISRNYNHTKKPKLLKPVKKKNGYLSCNINGKGYSIHRLVANNFITKVNNKPHINHIDGNKTNNRVDNLEWCTDSENMIHAFKNGLVNNRTETKINSCYININKATNKNKIKIYQYDKNGNYVNKYNSIIEASKLNGINATHISLCAKGKQKTCGGYIWKYEGLVYD